MVARVELLMVVAIAALAPAACGPGNLNTGNGDGGGNGAQSIHVTSASCVYIKTTNLGEDLYTCTVSGTMTGNVGDKVMSAYYNPGFESCSANCGSGGCPIGTGCAGLDSSNCSWGDSAALCDRKAGQPASGTFKITGDCSGTVQHMGDHMVIGAVLDEYPGTTAGTPRDVMTVTCGTGSGGNDGGTGGMDAGTPPMCDVSSQCAACINLTVNSACTGAFMQCYGYPINPSGGPCCASHTSAACQSCKSSTNLAAACQASCGSECGF
ncbi:MAG TPA: hypothetical protein VFF06_08915 [Polyangia bacterium]|nr:hypothetical protein [Polyangia bacterium]